MVFSHHRGTRLHYNGLFTREGNYIFNSKYVCM